MARDRELERLVARWRAQPRGRPTAIEPVGPGQESVWDYPRPPRIESVALPVRVRLGGRLVGASRRALRVLETASPPTFYLPRDDVDVSRLEPVADTTLCEWKGVARYFDARVDDRLARSAAWSYPDPLPGFEGLRDAVSFFPGRVDACFVGDEQVLPQPGGYYGGWITRNLRGPFKGAPGSEGW